MKVIKKTKDYVIYQKGSGRYAIKDADKNWVNADEKIKILLAEKLVKTVAPAPAPKKSEEAPAAPVEEAPADEAPAEKPKAKAKAKPKAKAAPKKD